MSEVKPDKSNLPYLISDLVLHGAALVKMPPNDAQTPEFRLVSTDAGKTIAAIRKLINAVYS